MKVKVIAPTYFYPGPIWEKILASTLNRDAISAVIINPHNGPGAVIDPEYLKLCTRLRKAGISILGYVSTKYGGREIEYILKDIDNWHKWYGVNDIFVDEAADGADMIGFYGDIYEEIHGKVVLNHGTVPDEEYRKVGDVLVVFEAEAAKLKGLKMPAWVIANRNQICAIVIDCPTQGMKNALVKVSSFARYVYITHDKEPNPYDVLPTYWNQLLQAVA